MRRDGFASRSPPPPAIAPPSGRRPEDVPLVLLEVAATESEAHAPPLEHDRTDLGVLDPGLLE
jgi:hypothetical protein